MDNSPEKLQHSMNNGKNTISSFIDLNMLKFSVENIVIFADKIFFLLIYDVITSIQIFV